jgi:hypothetical protein
MTHPTQILLHNPQALRVEYRLDDQRLILWWSPLAGKSHDAAERNFSNRDNHLDVFEEITLAGCGLGDFLGCDYDPYHCVLRFRAQILHIALRHDAAAVFLWAGQPLLVDFKSGRYDEVLDASPTGLGLLHSEPSHAFEFVAALGGGDGTIRHSPIRAKWRSTYSQAALSPGQLLVIGVGLGGGDTAARMRALAAIAPSVHLAATDAALDPIGDMGRIVSGRHPEMEKLRRTVVRGLHSMIDESGAMRASIKAIYYLIWVRDGGFCFPYQAAAGWTHKLPELCRFLLANPTRARGEGIPPGRMFAQLVDPDYGKYEEDGVFYVIWLAFTHWTQTGSREFFEGENLALIEEAVAWVEDHIFDPERGLFGGYFADETPAHMSRDYGWDAAIGKPGGDEHIWHEGRKIVRSYDIYINTLMHSAYTMLAAAGGVRHGEKAAALWKNLGPLYRDLRGSLPPYGDLVTGDGQTVRARHTGAHNTTFFWALSIPNFLPLDGRESMNAAVLDEIISKPEMHWINGICAAVAAADTWYHDESRLLDLLRRVADDTLEPGAFLPMGGAMPEKLGAPQGNIFHDIRPQAFAMGTWLGAWASLGLRRLPHGLALRPTRAFEKLLDFSWRGRTLDFFFDYNGRTPALEINGTRIAGTLQIPEGPLLRERNVVRLVEGDPGPLLLRSTARLDALRAGDGLLDYAFTCHGLTSICFHAPPAEIGLADAENNPVTFSSEGGEIRFTLHGPANLRVASLPRSPRPMPAASPLG